MTSMLTLRHTNDGATEMWLMAARSWQTLLYVRA